MNAVEGVFDGHHVGVYRSVLDQSSTTGGIRGGRYAYGGSVRRIGVPPEGFTERTRSEETAGTRAELILPERLPRTTIVQAMWLGRADPNVTPTETVTEIGTVSPVTGGSPV